LDAAVQRLLGELSNEDKQWIRKMPEHELSDFHFGWAMWVRHEFGLWQGNKSLLFSCGSLHPETAGMNIVCGVWKCLQYE